MDASEQTDFDGDGVGDNADNDDDNDGVLDTEDAYPKDSEKSELLDTDGDGIVDDLDQCPDTPEGELTDNVGCHSVEVQDDGDDGDDESSGVPGFTLIISLVATMGAAIIVRRRE